MKTPPALLALFPAKNRSVRWVKNGGGATLLDPRNGRYYRLNALGAYLWDRCDGSVRTNDMLSAIVKDYKTRSVRAQGDILDFLHILRRKGMINLHRSKLLPQ